MSLRSEAERRASVADHETLFNLIEALDENRPGGLGVDEMATLEVYLEEWDRRGLPRYLLPGSGE